MAAIRAKDTKPEMIVRRLLFRLGYRYRLHVTDLPGRPDIVFPRPRRIIEVRGCFWHRHTCKDGRTPKANATYWTQKIQKNVDRDRQNEQSLRELGWDVLVLWECEVMHDKPLEDRICAFLDEGTPGRAQRPNLGPADGVRKKRP
jgi:DNA mismatch endonuclease Vsr